MSTSTRRAMKVCEIMMGLDRFPVIPESMILKEALEQMGRSRLGIACIVDDAGHLSGILTDGDIRRVLLNVQKPFSALLVDDAIEHAIRSPVTIGPADLLVDAVGVMGRKKIWDLPVVDSDHVLQGLLHLHPAVEALLAVLPDGATP